MKVKSSSILAIASLVVQAMFSVLEPTQSQTIEHTGSAIDVPFTYAPATDPTSRSHHGPQLVSDRIDAPQPSSYHGMQSMVRMAQVRLSRDGDGSSGGEMVGRYDSSDGMYGGTVDRSSPIVRTGRHGLCFFSYP